MIFKHPLDQVLRAILMKILILGAGMMGNAITFDLVNFSKSDVFTIADKNLSSNSKAKKNLRNDKLEFVKINLENKNSIKKHFKENDLAISAVPFKYNYILSKIAIETKTHFIDLGGNNDVVQKELSLSKDAKKSDITIIPDCGLAPGLSSVIVKDIVENINDIDYVKIRVGGLPLHPKPPLNYQVVFSPFGLINEYVEKSVVLDHGKIIQKKSMTEVEKIYFPKPFGNLEAFLTSGGCSTLPFVYKNKIKYLDYKTIRYPGHCDNFNTILSLGMAKKHSINTGKQKIIPREILATLLNMNLPKNEDDVVLLKVLSRGVKDGKKCKLEYNLIDYYDQENKITSMMRTTAYPTSIIAQMILNESIDKRGVFCPHEIVPCQLFFKELKKRNIIIKKKFVYI